MLLDGYSSNQMTTSDFSCDNPRHRRGDLPTAAQDHVSVENGLLGIVRIWSQVLPGLI